MKVRFSFTPVLFILSISTLIVTLSAVFVVKPDVNDIPVGLNEDFDLLVMSINTTDKVNSLVLQEFERNGHDTAAIMFFVDDFLRKRFYHSYSELSFHDNWIAWLCGKLFWSHFSNPVVPSDIIRFPMAGCSQQAMIFQDAAHLLK